MCNSLVHIELNNKATAEERYRSPDRGCGAHAPRGAASGGREGGFEEESTLSIQKGGRGGVAI